VLSLPLFLFVICCAILGAFWQQSLSARERANRAAQRACARQHLQFLDGTVAFAKLALVRNADNLTFRRTYVFDYSSARVERLQGFVILLGQQLESIGFQSDLSTPTTLESSDLSTDDQPNDDGLH